MSLGSFWLIFIFIANLIFFQILLVIEEYYDNILVITKLERAFNNTINHQIYMHYTIFARLQSFLVSLQIFERKNEQKDDKDTLQ